ncbi:hypothetical protein G6F40_017136 [Rhizopus arrhizus]|nr:hypothetical protein G6F40_017136 [Rhizopus arrhizus]
MLFAVHDVGAGGAPVARLDQGFFDAVLDGFDAGAGLVRQGADDDIGQRRRARQIQLPGAGSGRRHGVRDLVAIKVRDAAVTLEDVLDRHY